MLQATIWLFVYKWDQRWTLPLVRRSPAAARYATFGRAPSDIYTALHAFTISPPILLAFHMQFLTPHNNVRIVVVHILDRVLNSRWCFSVSQCSCVSVHRLHKLTMASPWPGAHYKLEKWQGLVTVTNYFQKLLSNRRIRLRDFHRFLHLPRPIPVYCQTAICRHGPWTSRWHTLYIPQHHHTVVCVSPMYLACCP